MLLAEQTTAITSAPLSAIASSNGGLRHSRDLDQGETKRGGASISLPVAKFSD